MPNDQESASDAEVSRRKFLTFYRWAGLVFAVLCAAIGFSVFGVKGLVIGLIVGFLLF